MRLRLALVCGLLWLYFGADGANVPFSKELRPKFQKVFQEYSDLSSVDVYDAHASAFRLYDLAKSQDDRGLSSWALLVYSSSLLEVDSIAKAQRLLGSSSKEWTDLDEWLLSFQSLVSGQLSVFAGEYKKASQSFKAGLQNLDQEAHPKLYARLLIGLADNFRYQGKYDQSLNKWYEALQFCEDIKDSVEIVACYSGRGVIKFIQGDLKKAEEDFEVMFQFYQHKNNLKQIAYGYSLKGLISNSRRNHDEAIQFALKSYELRKQVGDVKGQGESLNNLALAHMGLKHWDQALRYLEEAVQLKTWANDQSEIPIILNNIGHCHQRLGDSESAEKYFNLALSKARESGQYDSVIRAYRNLTRLQAGQGNHKEAYALQTKMYQVKDSLSKAEKAETISDLEVQYETEKKEQEILLLQKDKNIVTNRWLTLALGLFLTIIIGILFIDNQKRKHREETMRLIGEDERKKAELREMTAQLESNKNKLSIYTENLLKKTELVGELENRLQEITQGSEASDKSIKLMKDLSNVRILTDQDWNEFKALFDNVYSGFLSRLLSDHPSLTLGDQRLILLMKLKLGSREIANILGVSPDSVKKSRYRLRKKIELPEATTLQLFVDRFK